MLTLNLQSLQLSLRLEITLIDNDELYYSHDNTACNHRCDECKKTNELNICHKLLYILWLLEQI